VILAALGLPVQTAHSIRFFAYPKNESTALIVCTPESKCDIYCIVFGPNRIRDFSCDRTGYDDPDVPTCVPLCTPAGDACSGLRIPLVERKRSLWQNTNPEAEPDDWALRNVSLKPHENAIKVRHLAKRAISAITEGQITTYVPAQWDESDGEFDQNFGFPSPLVEQVGDEESDNTVTNQTRFTNIAFQIGSRGLHGCTMVTVVSNRAVYMVR
jgi:hypothetical protein